MYVERLADTDFTVEIDKNCCGDYIVSLKGCEIKEGGMLIGEYGVGNSVEEAASDYIKKVSGKTLVCDAWKESRREFNIFLIQG